VTPLIEARWGVICHQGVSDGSDGALPLRLSHSTRTEIFFADVIDFATCKASKNVLLAVENAILIRYY
jgi:hypothetical protein